MGAIDAFQNVETHFNELQNIQGISHLIPIRNQAILERAKTNLKIAELSSQPAKKAIYLDYAEEVFLGLLSNLNKQSGSIYEETLYFLGLTQIQSGKTKQALETLESLIHHYKDKNVENDYYLASALYQKGLLENQPGSIELFDQALQAGKPNYLSNDEILNIMIAKAEIYRKEGKLDDAMLQLSEVVNYSTASSLRLKAMFLRAEIYTEQGRKPLAQKQLESIALKGGDWAIKAKEQLEKHHGYE
jgi:tetratricopeptide (TPR) repeat protein